MDTQDQAQAFAAHGGIVAAHAEDAPAPAVVAPASTAEFNLLGEALRSVACWCIDDVRFEFDSSFIQPEIQIEVAALLRLFQTHPPPSVARRLTPAQASGYPLSVFGHADPTGDDDYNKRLSGRRAQALYALLTRDVALWEQLFQQPVGHDRWDQAILLTMAQTLEQPPLAPVPPPETPGDDDAAAPGGGLLPFADDDTQGERPDCPIFALQRSAAEEPQAIGETDAAAEIAADQAAAPAASATPGAAADRAARAQHDTAERKRLFLDYMDRLCGPGCRLEKSDFLGAGEDAGGRADYQGCGEFNPLMLFSRAEQAGYSDPARFEDRNEQNAANRRVLVYLFRRGTRVDAKLWPCPRAVDGPSACRRRFWSDGDKRRANGAERREYFKTRDTFACRFYDRLARHSRCETSPTPVRVRLYDEDGAFIAHAPYRLALKGQPPFDGRASAKGIFSIRRTAGVIEGSIHWGVPPAPGQPARLAFQDHIFLEFPEDRQEAALRKLRNLGYGGSEAPASSRISAFQSDYRQQFALKVDGIADTRTLDAIDRVHDGSADSLKEPAP